MTWTSIVVANPEKVGYPTSIAVDKKGDIHIIYWNVSTLALMYLKKEGATWHSEKIDDMEKHNAYSSFSIAVDANNIPHVSYIQVRKPGLFEQGRLQYARRVSNNNWSRATVDPGVQGQILVGGSNAIAVDADNNPHFSYVVSPNDHVELGVLRYAKLNKQPGIELWITKELISEKEVGRSTSIAVDSDNIPHISFWNSVQRAVNYITQEGTTWNRDTVVVTGGSGVQNAANAIAVDGNRIPHIVYCNPTTRRVEYAKKQGTTWNRDTVGAVAVNYGEKPASIAVDSGNTPHISYYDAEAKDLRYAKKQGTTWSNELVDAGGDVGWQNDIAVDANRMPFIVYLSQTDHSVKCARIF